MKATGSKTRRMAQKGSSKPMETPSWVSDEESYSWFQRRFQGRKMKRGFQGRRKAKERAAKDPLESVFFKRKKGRSNLADGQTDSWQPDGQWQKQSMARSVLG